jgi:hypothetical protein
MGQGALSKPVVQWWLSLNSSKNAIQCAFHWAKLKILTKSRTIKVIIGHMLALSRTIQFGFDVKNQPRAIRLNIMCVEATRTISFFSNLSFRVSNREKARA